MRREVERLRRRFDGACVIGVSGPVRSFGADGLPMTASVGVIPRDHAMVVCIVEMQYCASVPREAPNLVKQRDGLADRGDNRGAPRHERKCAAIGARRTGSIPPSPTEVEKGRDPFLAALGERAKALRVRRGLTRKALARLTGVSERHLANLEYGVGNASILVLLQVAQALQCSLAELVGDVTTQSPEWLMLREMLSDQRRGDTAPRAAGGDRTHRRGARAQRGARRPARRGSRSSACAAQANQR